MLRVTTSSGLDKRILKATDRAVASMKTRTLIESDDDDAMDDTKDEVGNVEMMDSTDYHHEDHHMKSNCDHVDCNHLDQESGKEQSLLLTKSTFKHPMIKPNNGDWDGNARYLAWNAIGKIIARRDPTTNTQTIDIDFADLWQHRPVRFADQYQIHQAGLSLNGAVFASDHTVLYMPFGGWAVKVNTVLECGIDEVVVGVACTNDRIYILTSGSYLRVLDCSGIQEAIIAMPELSLCVIASLSSSSKDECLVLYQDGNNIRGLLVQGESMVQPIGSLCNQPLRWVGPSLPDLGLFGALDYAGRFFILMPPGQLYPLQWMLLHAPEADPRITGDTLWPIFFTSTAIHAIVLHDSARHPEILPVPLVSEVSFRVPLLKSPLEQQRHLHTSLMLNSLMLRVSHPGDERQLQTASDKATLELIQVHTQLDTFLCLPW